MVDAKTGIGPNVDESFSVPVAPSSMRTQEELPPLLADTAFWGMTAAQFLGTFNDNLFKQLLLLLGTPAAATAAAGDAKDNQWFATVVFASAFLCFSGFAGWLADRFSKRRLIIASKFAEIFVMALGLAGFLAYDLIGFNGMICILFLLGAQSAFFGPPKYGILPEMLSGRDLPRANGLFLTFTFLAVIFGTVLITLFGAAPNTAWRTGAFCIGVAVLGWLASLHLRATPIANPNARFRLVDLAVPPEVVRLVWKDKQLLLALLVTSSFWMLAGMVQNGVNSLGKTQLDLGRLTSLLTAMLGVGIPIGCLLGGSLSRGRINPWVVKVGAAGIVVALVLLSLPGGPRGHLLGFWGSIPVLIALGIFAGMFVVPVQVSLQVRPPINEKGRIIALMNQANWGGVVLGALVFGLTMHFLESRDWPRSLVFLVIAAIMLPIALFYRPEELKLSD